MELKKIKLHSCQKKGKAVNQITLDDDYNVPDYRPDIVKVLKEKGELVFDEVTPAAGAVWLKGKLVFKVLYRSDQENGKISSLRGEIPFQEKLNIEGLLEYDKVRAEGIIDDLSIGVIHSRKLSVRALIILKAEAEVEQEREICSGAAEGYSCEQRSRMADALQLMYAKKDFCRQKNEFSLPSSKPNVQEILWKSIEIRNVNTYLGTEGIKLSGEVLVSVLYSEEEETDRIQWYETVLPLECSAECDVREAAAAEKDAEIIYKIMVQPVSKELEVKPDYDGEERMLVMELGMNLDIRIWREEKIEVLEDLYSLEKQLIPVRENEVIESLLVKNDSQCRLTERIELEETQERILQICSCEGEVHLEKAVQREGGVFAEGILIAELLYITTDDKMPIGVLKQIYPFEQLIEMPEASGGLMMELECGLSQLSAVMLDQEHVEVKAVIGLELLALKEENISNITEVMEEPLDLEELQKKPGLIGYIAKEGDLLWSIAKENHTTVHEIMQNNNKKDERLERGERILVVKSVR